MTLKNARVRATESVSLLTIRVASTDQPNRTKVPIDIDNIEAIAILSGADI